MIRLRLQRKYPLWILSIAVLFTITAYFLYENGLIINITDSMPKGIYWRENGAIQRNDIIAFCLKPEYQKFALKRGYLIRAGGNRCQYSEPVIKKVIAAPGDNVILSEESITVNGKTYFYKTLHKDSNGRTLFTYPRRTYNNTPDYWLIGTSSTQSWDSRYFGPISPEAILWKIKPLLVFSPHATGRNARTAEKRISRQS